MKRSASSEWKGNLKEGSGTLNTGSGVLSQTPYSFSRRFGDEKGTNPEELIGAAHAGCFAMALSGELETKDITPNSIVVQAKVTLDKTSGGFGITSVHLDVLVDAQGDKKDIEAAAAFAKENCPVSKVLRADITMSLEIKKIND